LASTDTAEHPEQPTRRDFLYIATGAVGAVGAALTVWPLIHQMNPDAAALALATTMVDLSTVEPGMSVTVMWRGKPVFIQGTPATDENRAAEGRENWLVMVGICTHLGCVPLGEQGPYGGWFCPCHGSAYDTAGRIRQGPAPENLPVPIYEFLSDTQLRIG
jgi:ubiquinol-cytochrome c reductase iron-sulfur subunit